MRTIEESATGLSYVSRKPGIAQAHIDLKQRKPIAAREQPVVKKKVTLASSQSL